MVSDTLLRLYTIVATSNATLLSNIIGTLDTLLTEAFSQVYIL